MEKLVIEGQTRLSGEIKVNGAKNSAVAIIPAALLTKEPVTITNLPNISDIRDLVEILRSVGAKVKVLAKDAIYIDPRGVEPITPSYNLVKKLRASYYLLGVFLSRFKEAEIPLPGGCNLGPRPMDQHIKGFTALGAKVSTEHGSIRLEAQQLNGAVIYLDIVSVGATINLMLAAVRAEGKTVIENAAKEPEIVDVSNFLNAMGANVRGAGTDVIKIQGVKELTAVEHSVIPDRIEAGTFMLAAGATNGKLLIKEVIPKHVEPIIAKLLESGCRVEVRGDSILVEGKNNLTAIDIKTFPYPGFPTDLQSLMMVLLTKTKGTSIITENVFEKRFAHVDELKRMGAMIKLEGRSAVVEGRYDLTGCPIKATDLRAGAAFIIAGMMAKGQTCVYGLEHIDRGYEDIENRFNSIGAKIRREF